MLVRLLVLLFLFVGIGCKPLAPPEISFNRNTFVVYTLWEGEAGGGTTSLTVYGDGSVVYVDKPMPTSTINRNLKLDKEETVDFFRLLLDADLFRMKNHISMCCDIGGRVVSGMINSQPFSAACQFDCGDTWSLVSHFNPLLIRLHPERWDSRRTN